MHRRILAILSFGHLATDLSQGALPALLPLFKARYLLSYTDIGLIVLIANVSSSVIQPVFGLLSDRFRIRWLMPAGALLGGIGIVLAVLSPSYPAMIAMIFVCGLGIAAFHPEGYRFAGLAGGAGRATGMSYFSVGGNLGYGFGPAAAGVAIHLAGAPGILYVLAFSVPAAILLWRVASPHTRDRLESAWLSDGVPPEVEAGPPHAIPTAHPGADPHAGGPPRPGTRHAPRDAGARRALLALLVTFVVLRSWVSVGEASFIPLYFTAVRHLEAWYGGIMVSMFLGAGAVGTLLGGMAADRWGRRRMLIASMAVLPPLLWALPRGGLALSLTAALVSGMAVVSTFAVIMVMAQELVPERVGLMSGLIIGFAVGTGGVGATLLGAIADRWGVLRALDVTALLPAAALAIAMILPPDPPLVRDPVLRPGRTSVSGAEAE